MLFTGGCWPAADPPVNIWALLLSVPVVAILGDQVAYFIGRKIGPALFDKEDSRFFKHYVTQSHAFFERHGAKTIILARFVPIVRTFAPVIAGVSYMRYRVFLAYNIIGGVLVCGVTAVGYFLGNVPLVKSNLELVILLIVFLSILPGITAVGRNLMRRRGAVPGWTESVRTPEGSLSPPGLRREPEPVRTPKGAQSPSGLRRVLTNSGLERDWARQNLNRLDPGPRGPVGPPSCSTAGCGSGNL